MQREKFLTKRKALSQRLLLCAPTGKEAPSALVKHAPRISPRRPLSFCMKYDNRCITMMRPLPRPRKRERGAHASVNALANQHRETCARETFKDARKTAHAELRICGRDVPGNSKSFAGACARRARGTTSLRVQRCKSIEDGHTNGPGLRFVSRGKVAGDRRGEAPQRGAPASAGKARPAEELSSLLFRVKILSIANILLGPWTKHGSQMSHSIAHMYRTNIATVLSYIFCQYIA